MAEDFCLPIALSRLRRRSSSTLAQSCFQAVFNPCTSVLSWWSLSGPRNFSSAFANAPIASNFHPKHMSLWHRYVRLCHIWEDRLSFVSHSVDPISCFESRISACILFASSGRNFGFSHPSPASNDLSVLSYGDILPPVQSLDVSLVLSAPTLF